MRDDDSRLSQTAALPPERTPSLPIQPGTGPLDYAMPWVIEFRVVGTPSVLQVQVREFMMIGRSDKETSTKPDIDLEPYKGYQSGVSRRHAMISARNSRVSVKDVGSSNGTFINGARLEVDQEYRLRHGDTLTLGKIELQVFFVVTPSSHEKNHLPFSEILIPHIGEGQEVLIVEDDQQVAQALGSLLEQAGFKFVWRSTITDALTRVDEHMPDIVILELILPDRNGLELVTYIRNHEKGKSVPLVVVSGAAGGYQMGQAVEAGIDIFLSKPVGVDELLRGLSKVLAENKA